MRHSELQKLETFCRKYGLDPQLIDKAISFSENMEFLGRFMVGEEPEASEVGALQEWYNAQSYAATYGPIPEGTIPPQFYRTLIYFRSRRQQVRFQRTKHGQIDPHKIAYHKLIPLPPLVRFINWVVPDPKVIERINYSKGRFDGYILLHGQPEDNSQAILTLERHGQVRQIRTEHVYDPRVQHIPNRGWVLRPEQPRRLEVFRGQFRIVS